MAVVVGIVIIRFDVVLDHHRNFISKIINIVRSYIFKRSSKFCYS